VEPLSVAPASDRCFLSFAGLNENASVPFDQYRQNNGRWWVDYQATFQPSEGRDLFQRHVRALKTDDVVIDVGSGKGIALMQLLAEKPKIRGVAINAQDPLAYYERAERLGDAVRRRGTEALEFVTPPAADKGRREPSNERQLATVDGVFQRDLVGFAVACDHELPTWMRGSVPEGFRISAEEAGRDLDALGARFRAWREKAGLVTEVGSALEKLGAYKGSAALLVDVYGAYFYGSDRVPLLEAYYAALRPGGRAFIAMGTSDEYGGDLVYRKGSVAPMALSTYLVSRYPDVFDVAQTPSGRWFLVLEKPVDGPAALRIPLKTVGRDHYVRNTEGGFVVPMLTLQEE
jgi:SAM-dependent methyltransferase